jgi:integrase
VASIQLEGQERNLQESFDLEREIAAQNTADLLVRSIRSVAAAPDDRRAPSPASDFPLPAKALGTESSGEDARAAWKLSEVLKDFLADKASSKDPLRADSVAGYEETVDLFIECFGDLPLPAITRAVGRQFLDTLTRLPPNRNKSPAYRSLTIKQLLAADAPRKLAPRTINKNMERLSSLLGWAGHTGGYGLDRSPIQGLGVPDSPQKHRRGYTEDELAQLFRSDAYAAGRHDKAFKYWLPLLGLYTGARLTELAQLDVSDFVVDQGCDCISINGDDVDSVKRVKTKNSVRKVPVHSELKRLGLLGWVEELRAGGRKKLFDLPIQKTKGYGQAASKWFGRYRAAQGLTTGELDFHSFRTTFISRLLDQGIEQHQVAQLVGHEKGLITSDVYWRPDMIALAELMKRLDFPAVRDLVRPFA